MLEFIIVEVLGVWVRYCFFKVLGKPKTLIELRGGDSIFELWRDYSFWNVLVGATLFLVILFSLLFVILT